MATRQRGASDAARRTPHLPALSSVGIFPVLNCRLDALGYPRCRASLSMDALRNLPGSVITPTRLVADPAISRNPRPGCRHRQRPCRPGRRRYGPRSQTTIAASCNAFPASMVAAGSPAAWAVSSRNAATTTPTVDQGWLRRHRPRAVAVVASWRRPGVPSPPPSSPRRQPTAPPAALPPGPKADRPRRTHDAPMPVCRTARPPWPIAPGSGCALSAAPECWQWSLAYSALPIPSQI